MALQLSTSRLLKPPLIRQVGYDFAVYGGEGTHAQAAPAAHIHL